jgi:hypothetical protein
MINIEIKDWDHTCGDGCCYTWGKAVYVNGKEVTQHAENTEELLEGLMLMLGFEKGEFKIE